MNLSTIVAIARNGVIGKGGGLPWRVREDLRHFKAVTMDHTLIVGRKTAETLPKLQGRKLVVVSRAGVAPPQVIAADNRVLHVRTTIEEAITVARETDPEPIVIGGAEVYRAAMPYVSRIYLTEIDRDVDGDTRFDLDRTGFAEVARRQGEERDVAFVTLERRLS